MATNKRATVYFDPKLHRALRVKAAVAARELEGLPIKHRRSEGQLLKSLICNR